MNQRDPTKLAKLLRQNRLGKRASQLVQRWSSFGVSASPIAHDRYWLLVDKLGGGRSWPLRYSDDLISQLQDFASDCDFMTVMGWNLEDEPALLVSTDKILKNPKALGIIYPDGYVLVHDARAKAFLVDIDDYDGTYFDVVDLPSPA